MIFLNNNGSFVCIAASTEATLWSLPLQDLHASRYSLSKAKFLILFLKFWWSSEASKSILSSGALGIACKFSAWAAKGHKYNFPCKSVKASLTQQLPKICLVSSSGLS